jgi:surface antigen
MTRALSLFALFIFCAVALVGCPDREPHPPGPAPSHTLQGGLQVVPKPGTVLDEDELQARGHLATTLWTPEGPWELRGVTLSLQDLVVEDFQERDVGDGRRVWLGARDGDAQQPDCWLLLQVAEERWLAAQRPSEGQACEAYAQELSWFPEAWFLGDLSSSLTGERAQGLSFGQQIGTFNGVPAYSNGSTTYNSGKYSCCGLMWQCVEYVNRYYHQKLGHANLKGTGHAKSYFGTAASKGLAAYPNGGPMKPAVGDMITSAGGTYGHIGLVREVGSNHVKVIHQNWSNGKADESLTLSLSSSGGKFTVGGFSSSYPVQGWLRKAPKVSSVTPSTATLNQPTTFTVKGTALPSTLAAWIDGCTQLTMLSVTSTQAQFRCTPSYSKGTKAAVLKTYSGGTTLLNWSIQVN